jgi:cytidylate kinase
MIITIDGPAGAGKSTAARALARRLGFDFLDTGAMYRAVAVAAQQAGIDLAKDEQVNQLLEHLHLEMPAGRVILNGVDVSEQIRTPEITTLARAVADHAAVRRHLSRLQREIAAGRDIVTEGRDQGTVVFPDAQCKFFLTADPQERARRRAAEMQAKGQNIPLEEVLASQVERDARDAARSIAPMVPAHDATMLDTTQLSIEEVVEHMERRVKSVIGERRSVSST